MNQDSSTENRGNGSGFTRRDFLRKVRNAGLGALGLMTVGAGASHVSAENAAQNESIGKGQPFCCEKLDPKYFNYPLATSDSRDQVVAQSQQESDFEIYGEYMNKVRTEAQRILKEDWGVTDGFYIQPAIYKGDLYSVDPEGNIYIAVAATLRSWEDPKHPTPDARITLAKDAKDWSWEKMQEVLRHEIGHALGVEYLIDGNTNSHSEHNPDYYSTMFWLLDLNVKRSIKNQDRAVTRWSMQKFLEDHPPKNSPPPQPVQPPRPEGMTSQAVIPGISKDQ